MLGRFGTRTVRHVLICGALLVVSAVGIVMLSKGVAMDPGRFYDSSWYFHSGQERSFDATEGATAESVAHIVMNDYLERAAGQDGVADIFVLMDTGVQSNSLAEVYLNGNWELWYLIPVAEPRPQAQTWDDLALTGAYICVMKGPKGSVTSFSIRQIDNGQWQATAGGLEYPDQFLVALDVIREEIGEEPSECRVILSYSDLFAWLAAKPSEGDAILGVATLEGWPTPRFGEFVARADRVYPLAVLSERVSYPWANPFRSY